VGKSWLLNTGIGGRLLRCAVSIKYTSHFEDLEEKRI
jgi:hypothetical protein